MSILSMDEVAEISKHVRIEAKADVWRDKARKLKVAEEEEKIAREELIAECGADFEGCGVCVKQVERKGAIEYTMIPELADVNLEQYRKKGTIYWTVKASVKE